MMKTPPQNGPKPTSGYWNYRLVAESKSVTMCEVYYDRKGYPEAYCHAGYYAPNKTELQADMNYMMAAFNKPVLRPIDFKKIKPTKKEKTK